MKKPLSIPGKTIYLVRHGLSTLDPQGYGNRKMTAGLLPQGKEAVENIARYLKDVPESDNISSPVPRCLETAAIIFRITGKEFRTDKRLTEFHEESFDQFYARVRGFTEALQQMPHGNIIICSHSAVITGIQDFLTGRDFEFREEYDYPKEGELVIVTDRDSRTISFNGTDSG